MADQDRWIAVCGATGRQGGAVTRALLAQGWRVRALTRRPNNERARDLRRIGAEVTSADMEDPVSLRDSFDGVYGVFSVQNGLANGFDREVIQGRNVATAAKQSGVSHLVYASAGTGARDTGVPSWDAKIQVEDHMKRQGLPFTSLRPQALMELMTEKSYYPQLGTWNIWPRIYGDNRPVPWMAVEDVGLIAAAVFAGTNRYAGQSLVLVGDVQSLAQCRDIYRGVIGKYPRSFPVPIWLFDRFTRGDVTAIWRYAANGEVPLDTTATQAIHPNPLSVRQWLMKTCDRQVGLTEDQQGGRRGT
ncbi:MAG TPA: NmrA/HSCARG family protein [Acidimicrobiia bacterium]|nr:NmrA/HSCARG family protein [Acidimicrobiia bacterium]